LDCGTSIGHNVQRICNRTSDVTLVYRQCYVRLSNTDFLASPNNSGEVRLISSNNISNGVDVAAYDRALTELHKATVRYAVEKSPRRLFTTGHQVGLNPRSPTSGPWRSARRTCRRRSAGRALTT
jgi:hypothetical protein